MGKGRSLDEVLKGMVMVAEGVATTKSVHQLTEKHETEVPIVSEVYKVLFEGKAPYQAMIDLMTRDVKGE